MGEVEKFYVQNGLKYGQNQTNLGLLDLVLDGEQESIKYLANSTTSSCEARSHIPRPIPAHLMGRCP